jgi:hypothetical protein
MDAARNRLNIVILDACRNNPFARSFRSTQKGLATTDAPGGTLIAYATAPGSVASDGTGRNGLYTQELLKYMKQPNLNILQVFMKVRAAVRSQTQGKQVPWESSSLERDFYFSSIASETGAAKNTPPPVLDPVAIELSFWESIKNSNDVDDYKAYLDKYPNGSFTSLARNKLRSLEASAKSTAPNTTPPAQPKSHAENPKGNERETIIGDPISGVWDGKYGPGAFPFLLKLKLQGNNVSGEHILGGVSSSVVNGKWTGTELEFTTLHNNSRIKMVATLTSGSLIGKKYIDGNTTPLEWSAVKK